jgi:hypothetical protein
VLLVLGEAFLGVRVVMNAARAATEGNSVIPLDKASIYATSVLKGLVDEAAVHAHYSSVVAEVVAKPFSAGKAYSAITAAVVDAAVVANVPSPVAFMEEETTLLPTPVAGSPEQTRSRCGHPSAGNPIVAGLVMIPGPIAWSPHQAGFRAWRLLVDRQRRWGKAYADGDLCVAGDRKNRQKQRQQKPAYRAQMLHE